MLHSIDHQELYLFLCFTKYYIAYVLLLLNIMLHCSFHFTRQFCFEIYWPWVRAGALRDEILGKITARFKSTFCGSFGFWFPYQPSISVLTSASIFAWYSNHNGNMLLFKSNLLNYSIFFYLQLIFYTPGWNVLGECLFYEVNDPLLQVCYKP